MKVQTTNQEIVETMNHINGLENTLLGQMLYGAARFRQIQNFLGMRYMGITERAASLKEKYFVLVNGQVQFDEVPSKEPEGKPTQEPRLKEGMSKDDYNKEMGELMNTKIEI